MAVSHPSPTDGWERLSAEAQLEILNGDNAIRRIREYEDYHRWLEVGRAFLRLQSEAIYLSGGNRPFGRAYTRARAELGAHVPDLESINRTTRAHAVWLAENAVAVEEWRKTLATNQREELNHPSAIRRRFDAAHAVPVQRDPATKPATPLERANVEVARLQEELDTANAKVRKLERGTDNISEGRDWMWTDTPETIAAVWLSLQPHKAPQIASKVLELNKSTAKRPRRPKAETKE
jgi:hypothetical protein